MPSHFEKVSMTPDAAVCWLRGVYDWGEIIFAEDAALATRRILKTLSTKGGASIAGANMVRRTEKDGVLWRVGDTALKHYSSYSAPDALHATKANVTLGVGLELIDAHTEGMPLRAPAYFALARPKRDWLGRGGHDGLAMAFIEGKCPTQQEFTVGLQERQILYDGAIAACGGNPLHYIYDEAPRNYLLGTDGSAYKLDIDMH